MQRAYIRGAFTARARTLIDVEKPRAHGAEFVLAELARSAHPPRHTRVGQAFEVVAHQRALARLNQFVEASEHVLCGALLLVVRIEFAGEAEAFIVVADWLH